MSKQTEAVWFDILGEPPTSEALEAAKTHLCAAERAQRTRRRQRAVALSTIAAFVIVGAGLYWESWSASALALGICAVLWLIGIEDWGGGGEPSATEELRQLEPAAACFLGDMIAACELDPRADAYRLKVVAQGRDFVAAEVVAFRVWKDGKGSRQWAVAHSPEPIERDLNLAGRG